MGHKMNKGVGDQNRATGQDSYGNGLALSPECDGANQIQNLWDNDKQQPIG